MDRFRSSLSAAVLASLAPSLAWAGPAGGADETRAEAPEAETELQGRVVEAGGSREGVEGAVVALVDAPASVRPGRRARSPLDPDAIRWMRRAETDAEGRFVLTKVPLGKVRVVVVAAGYLRLDRWAEVRGEKGEELRLYLEPEAEAGAYRTEVRTDRPRGAEIEAVNTLDGQRARRYAGTGDDPLLASLNMPGVARSPGGLGLLSFRGGDPRDTGYILDNHRIPRAFHIVPVASVVSPMMVESVEMYPGNYAAAYGGFGSGLVEIRSRPGSSSGVHGDAHLDLFDLGASLSAPVGPGSIHFGARRSHVDAVVRGAGKIEERLARRSGDTPGGLSNVILPRYWDYLGRFDLPLGGGHSLSLRALGAGDRFEGDVPTIEWRPEDYFEAGPQDLEFSAAFHRFDLEYAAKTRDWRALVSPSLRLDSSRLDQLGGSTSREARVFSLRSYSEHDLGRRLTVQIGADLVVDSWRRRETTNAVTPLGERVEERADSRDEEIDYGLWLSAGLHLGAWELTPSLRLNLFSRAGIEELRVDPRLDLRGRVHPKLELYARLGMYSIPLVVRLHSVSEIVPENPLVSSGIVDVPEYLRYYFDPGIDGAVFDGGVAVVQVVQASTGLEAELPWSLALRVGGYWRERPSATLRYRQPPLGGLTLQSYGGVHIFGKRRAMGLELLLRRELAADVEGWIGYTLNWSRTQELDTDFVDGAPRSSWRWAPTTFDQRHNLVAVISAALPRGFRFGARFRLVSGNPDAPILGVEINAEADAPAWDHQPIRGRFGSDYRPLFHQLDLRLDKDWTLRRLTLTAYVDIQNVYNNRYPEIYIYSTDWQERHSLVGLPIFPSLGVQARF